MHVEDPGTLAPGRLGASAGSLLPVLLGAAAVVAISVAVLTVGWVLVLEDGPAVEPAPSDRIPPGERADIPPEAQLPTVSDAEGEPESDAAGSTLSRHLLGPDDRMELERLGLERPVQALVEDLLSRPALIPFEGVAGGTMGFHDRSDIRVLGRRWVIAGFDDGHIAGRMLLRYEVGPEGGIRWEVMDAYVR